MPTGYTYPVQDGEITSLADFIRQCAPAVIIQMRDSRLGSPIPEVDPGDMLHAQARLTDVELEVEYWKAAGGVELAKHRDQRAAEWLAEVTVAKARQEANMGRYQAMRAKVQAWEPPAEMDGLQHFMLEQLDDSIKWETTDWDKQLTAAQEAAEEPLVDFQTRMIDQADRMRTAAQRDLEKARERYAANMRFRAVLMAELDKVRKAEADDAATGE